MSAGAWNEVQGGSILGGVREKKAQKGGGSGRRRNARTRTHKKKLSDRFEDLYVGKGLRDAARQSLARGVQGGPLLKSAVFAAV